MTGILEGQRALVTAGGSGIGLACAKVLARDGANVVIMGRTEERLQNAIMEIDSENPDARVQYSAGDVGTESDVQAAVEAACDDTGKLDICVACAGVGTLGSVVATPDSEWQRVMQTNLAGTFYTIKYAGTAMAKSGGGAICAISSIAGVRTHRFMGAYCASKAGVDMLVRNAADEMGTVNVRINSVCPGLVKTEAADVLMTTESVFEDYLDCMPLRRNGVVEDVASAVRFLCGPESSWITGVTLSVDGGHHLRRGPNIEPLSRMIFGDDITDFKMS
jgi:NAD(P)-dependent dehydrogenase (short-subunit alcohol dehydrogenase family)